MSPSIDLYYHGEMDFLSSILTVEYREHSSGKYIHNSVANQNLKLSNLMPSHRLRHENCPTITTSCQFAINANQENPQHLTLITRTLLRLHRQTIPQSQQWLPPQPQPSNGSPENASQPYYLTPRPPHPWQSSMSATTTTSVAT